MNWDISIPSIIGHLSGMLFDNNTDNYQSKIIDLEKQCISQFAEMFSYPPTENAIDHDREEKSWGHFTSGGTVANCEALWVARNMKYLTFSLRKFIESLD